MEEESLTTQIAKMQSDLAQLQSTPAKKFNMPWASRFSKGKVMRKEWVHVWMLKSNNSIIVKTVKIDDDTVKIGDCFYDARAGNMFRWKGMPVLILKEWNISPETPPSSHCFESGEDYKKAEAQGKLTPALKLIYTRMKMDAIKGKMNINMGMVAIFGVLAVGAYFLLSYMGYV